MAAQNNGALNGAVQFKAGLFGQAAYGFQGGTSISLPDVSASLNAGYTVSLRVNCPNVPSGVGILYGAGGQASADVPAAWVGIQSGGTFVAQPYGGAGSTLNSGVNVCDGAWHQIMVYYSPSAATLYLDGTQVATGSSGAIQSGGESLGASLDKNYAVSTSTVIDEVALFTGNEHSAESSVPGSAYANNASNLVALWHLDGNANDSATSGTTLPPVGTIAIAPTNFPLGVATPFIITGTGTSWTSSTRPTVTGTGAFISNTAVSGQTLSGTLLPGNTAGTLTVGNTTDTATASVTAVANITTTVNFDGDSLTRGYEGTGDNTINATRLQVTATSVGPTAVIFNTGVGGQTIAQMTSRLAANAGANYQAGKVNVLVIQGGHNDIAAGSTATQVEAAWSAYLTTAKAAHPDWRIVWETELPAANPGVYPANFDTTRNTVNAWIRANWQALGVCRLSDVASDAVIGQDGQEYNSSYFQSDYTHLNDAGYTRMGNYDQAAVHAAINSCATQGRSNLFPSFNAGTVAGGGSTGTTPAANAMSVMSLGTDQPWNGFIPGASTDILRQDVSASPVSPRNASFQTAFGSLPVDVDTSIPINTNDSSTQQGAWHTVTINAGYPIPQIFLTGNELVEPGSDHHLIVMNRATHSGCDLYHFQQNTDGTLQADSGYCYDMTSALDGQTGIGLDTTTLAGTPRGPALLRYEDAVAGTIHYAIPFTTSTASRFFSSQGRCFYGVVPPATHGDRGVACQGNPATSVPALASGDRFVLDPSFDTSTFAPIVHNILEAMKHTGIEWDDIGGPGRAILLLANNPGWDVNTLAQIKAAVKMANFIQVQVNGAVPTLPDSNDDANGSDTVNYAWNQTGPDGSGNYTTTATLIPNPYNRPTVTASVTPTSVAVGGSVTLQANCTNGLNPYFDTAPPLTNGSISIVPLQTTTYTPWCRGQYGIAKGTPVTVTVTGTQAQAANCTPGSGSYTTAETVSCSTSTAGATIHAETGGLTATINSPVYSGPYTFIKPTHLSTIVGGPGFIQSSVSSYDYAIPVQHGLVQQATGWPTVTLPAAPVSGHILLMFVSTDPNRTPDTPSGCTLLSQTQNDTGARLSAFTCSDVGTGTYTFTGGATGYAQAAVLEWAGSNIAGIQYNNASVPMVVSNGTTTRTTAPVTPAASTMSAVVAWGGGAAGNGSPHTVTSGWTQTDATGVAYGNLTFATLNSFTPDTSTPVQASFTGPTVTQFDTNGGASNTLTVLLP